VELMSDGPVAINEEEWVFRNFEGRRFTYPLS
jgi:hypothetical protein